MNEAQECITEYYELWFEQSSTKSKSLDNPNLLKSPEMTDEEVLQHCRKAANSEKFNRLHSGDISGYHSNSEGQHAYCYLLVFYTQNIEQIDRMLRATGLYDGKWNRRGKYTLDKVLNGLIEVYQEIQNNQETTPKIKELSVDEIKARKESFKDRRLPLVLPPSHFISIFCNWLRGITDGYEDYQTIGGL